MSFAETICVTITCDGNCQHGGWNEGGPFHFESREKAEQYVRRQGWLVTDSRVLCEGCVSRAECEATGHQFEGDWHEIETKGVRYRKRYCSHCDHAVYDPPFEQLAVLSAAARVVDGAQLDGGAS